MTRRELLVGATAAGLALSPVARAVLFADPYAPFHMGIQSYSLRGYELPRALKEAKALGLSAWEAYPGHVPATTDAAKLAELAKLHKDSGVRIHAWGVVGFDGNEAASRAQFVFAKKLGIKVISADPAPESFVTLDKLVKEFDIRIAIHNHGPGARYSTLDQLTKAIDGHDWRVGVCIDTGHALRSKQDPVEWAKTLGKRVHGCHLKDVKDATKFTILGEGDLRLDEMVRVLRKQKFDQLMSLEYEEKPEDPREDIKLCLAATQKAIKASS
ncbi:MAG: sugar phosphate isomerase/epimerase [Armatimonadetes bacterium]|nr:sugar phosphate isomerase/epimerase [Armatimonadota bacterium]